MLYVISQIWCVFTENTVTISVGLILILIVCNNIKLLAGLKCLCRCVSVCLFWRQAVLYNFCLAWRLAIILNQMQKSIATHCHYKNMNLRPPGVLDCDPVLCCLLSEASAKHLLWQSADRLAPLVSWQILPPVTLSSCNNFTFFSRGNKWLTNFECETWDVF